VTRTRVPTPELPAPSVLSAFDSCDRCGSQAYVSVLLPTGQLFFCAHHYQQHEQTLRVLATSVCDERHRLAAVS
jgi:hypothetical protein